MENLNLKKVWEIMNKLSYEETKLSEEQDKWVKLLGHNSEYYVTDFESFLDYYSFKIKDGRLCIFNDDSVGYEDYDNNDFSYIALYLLEFAEKDLEKWIETEIKNQLEQQNKDKIANKENLKLEIEQLTKRLNNL